MERNLVITKSNALIEASYKLNLNEQRLVLSCIAELDSRRPAPKDSMFTVSVKEFSDTWGIQEKHAYEHLEEAANSLYERDIRTYDNKTPERFRWVFHVKYNKGKGCVTLGFSPTILPYLTMLNARFTSYHLTKVAGLRSVYSIRLFELLMQFKKTGFFTITLDDFKKRLDLGSKYDRFSNLKARVIEPAVKELSDKNNMLINWSAHRKGRSVERLDFNFKESEQMALAL